MSKHLSSIPPSESDNPTSSLTSERLLAFANVPSPLRLCVSNLWSTPEIQISNTYPTYRFIYIYEYILHVRLKYFLIGRSFANSFRFLFTPSHNAGNEVCNLFGVYLSEAKLLFRSSLNLLSLLRQLVHTLLELFMSLFAASPSLAKRLIKAFNVFLRPSKERRATVWNDAALRIPTKACCQLLLSHRHSMEVEGPVHFSRGAQKICLRRSSESQDTVGIVIETHGEALDARTFEETWHLNLAGWIRPISSALHLWPAKAQNAFKVTSQGIIGCFCMGTLGY